MAAGNSTSTYDWKVGPSEVNPQAGQGKTILRDIVIPIDNSKDSETAVAYALHYVCRTAGDKIHFLYIVPEPPMHVHPVWPSVYMPTDVDEQEEKEYEEAMAMIEKRFAPMLESSEVGIASRTLLRLLFRKFGDIYGFRMKCQYLVSNLATLL